MSPRTIASSTAITLFLIAPSFGALLMFESFVNLYFEEWSWCAIYWFPKSTALLFWDILNFVVLFNAGDLFSWSNFLLFFFGLTDLDGLTTLVATFWDCKVLSNLDVSIDCYLVSFFFCVAFDWLFCPLLFCYDKASCLFVMLLWLNLVGVTAFALTSPGLWQVLETSFCFVFFSTMFLVKGAFRD